MSQSLPRTQIHMQIRGKARKLLSLKVRAKLRRKLAKILKGSVSTKNRSARGGRSIIELSVLCTDDDEMRTLNRGYRKKDKTTDVLAFAAQEARELEFSAGDTTTLGDVVVSVEQAKRQMPSRDLEAEITKLLIHGICHLQGYDHQNDAQERKMKAEELRLSKLLVTRR